MRKWRHSNPYAEALIDELHLVGWKSRRELEAERQQREKIESEAAELERRRQRAAELDARARRLGRLAATAALHRHCRSRAGRRRAAELAELAREAEHVARVAALDVPVPWSDLSPAELYFRWMLERAGRAEDGDASHYSVWARRVRAARKPR